MNKYRAILFDMDGTLLPMDMQEFTSGYFKLLYKDLEEYGIPFDVLVKAIWDGTHTMARNDGSRLNREVFWKRFEELIPNMPVEDISIKCDAFYSNGFKDAIRFTSPNPLAKMAVEIAHEKAPIVALATNPLFPRNGQITRMGWLGLTTEDFDIVTSYETDYYCKPNPNYFVSVCERLNVRPEECLMIGNDEEEDMYACTLANIDGYLVTDTMISSKEHPWQGPRGTFEELIEMLKKL